MEVVYVKNHHPCTFGSLVMALIFVISLGMYYYFQFTILVSRGNSSDFSLSLYYYNSMISIGQGSDMGLCELLSIFIPIVHSGSGETTKVVAESCWTHYEVNLSTVSF